MKPEEFDALPFSLIEELGIELLDGRVSYMVPAGDEHGEGHSDAIIWTGGYTVPRRKTGLQVRTDTLVRLPTGDRLAPDVMVFREGSLVRAADSVLEGVPELVLEVSASSVFRDLTKKRAAYAAAGVREYIVWDVIERSLVWFRLEGSDYRELDPDESGIIESVEFPGLRLAVDALLAGDLETVLAEVRRQP